MTVTQHLIYDEFEIGLTLHSILFWPKAIYIHNFQS